MASDTSLIFNLVARDRASSAIGEVGNKIKAAAAVTGAAVGAMAAKGLKDFADFESGMNLVFTLLPDISQPAMDDMSSQARKLSRDFGILPDETVPALYKALSAGVPADNVFDFMETSMKLSKAGAAELEPTLAALTVTMNSYGLEADQAERISDVMLATLHKGDTTLEELAGSWSTATGVASDFGVSVEETGAAIALMTKQGDSAAEGATKWRSMLAELGQSGTKANEAFKELAGEGFIDFIEGGGTIREAMTMLKKEADSSGLKMLDFFGSVEAGAMASALTTEAGAAIHTEAMAAIEDSAGKTGIAYEQMDQGINANMAEVNATVHDLSISFGQLLAPAAMAVLEPALKIAQWAADNPGLVLPVVAVVGVLAAGLTALAVAQWAVNIAMSLNPIGLIVLAIVALIAVIVYIATQTTIFQDTWNWVWGKVLGIASWAVERIRAAWSNIRKYLIDPVLSAYSWVTTKIDALVTYARGLPGRISNAVSGMWDGMKSAFRGAINWVISKWNNLSFTLPSVRVPGIGTIGGATIHTPNIPFMATGGVIQQAGMAVVGDAGPELVHLSRGAQVTPLTGGGGGRGGEQRIVLEFRGEGEILTLLARAIRTRGGDVQTVLGGA